MASIVYQVKFSNTKKIDELVDKPDDEATSNFSIVRTAHSKIVEYRKQLKIMAVKAAKDKALISANLLMNNLDQLITIVEPQESVSSDVFSEGEKYSNSVSSGKETLEGFDANNSGVNYCKIKLRSKVKVLYALK